MAKILVIEDEPTLLNEVSEWLTLEGYEVVTATDGLEGVNAAVRHLPDLIICDITMPNLDGYGVLQDIRANSLTQGMPFIFTTARVTHDDIRQGMNQGADDYITKPYTNRELIQAVEARLDKKAAEKREKDIELESLRQRLEHEHEQRTLKAQMVAMFVHDFRNPMATIISSIELLRNYADRMDEQRRLQHLDNVESSARQLIQMLDDMLFLAQADADRLTVKPEPLEIGQFVGRIVEEFRAADGQAHELFYESCLTDRVMIDPRLLRQIAANLISNAIKYSPPGSRVCIALDNEDGQHTITIQDEGIGISETDQQRVFSSFQRGSNVAQVSGTGLGLAIVQQALDLLGGSFHLESQVGVGTTVSVNFPVNNIGARG